MGDRTGALRKLRFHHGEIQKLLDELEGDTPSAVSAPAIAEQDAWADVNLRRDCVTVQQAADLLICSVDTIRNRIEEETEFCEKTGRKRTYTMMINNRWWLRRDLLKALCAQKFR